AGGPESRGAAPDPAPQSPEGLEMGRPETQREARKNEGLDGARSAEATPHGLGQEAEQHVDQEAL
ncbi:hypothetical protein ACFC5R_14455, partial [Streptomyces rubiginosohelvolus]